MLAINRGEKEGFLSVTVLLDRETATHRPAPGGGKARLCGHGVYQERLRGRL